MPLDIQALRRGIDPEAFAEDDPEMLESRFGNLGISEREPVRIWSPTHIPGFHPVDETSWNDEGEGDLDAQQLRQADGMMFEGGLDLLAYYRSYHVDQAGWGIYIREWGLKYLTKRLDGRRDLAFRALWLHEYFHFLTNVAATSIEISSGRAIYRPYLRRDHRVWAGCRLDEALANAYSLDHIGRRHGKGALRRFMDRQPPGYRDYGLYERRAADDGLTRGYRELAAHLVDLPHPCDPSRIEAELGELLIDDIGRAVLPTDVPIYFVPMTRQTLFPRIDSWVELIPEIYEPPRFRKDLKRLPVAIQKKWTSVKVDLARSTRDSGRNLEKLRGSGDRYSVRVNDSVRVILQQDGSDWSAVTIGQHDVAYSRGMRRIGGLSGRTG